MLSHVLSIESGIHLVKQIHILLKGNNYIEGIKMARAAKMSHFLTNREYFVDISPNVG